MEQENGHRIKFEVADTGISIPAEKLCGLCGFVFNFDSGFAGVVSYRSSSFPNSSTGRGRLKK